MRFSDKGFLNDFLKTKKMADYSPLLKAYLSMRGQGPHLACTSTPFMHA